MWRRQLFTARRREIAAIMPFHNGRTILMDASYKNSIAFLKVLP